MIAREQGRLKRLRALCAALALLVGALAAPVALALQPTGVCSMTCCVEAGHCCCTPRQPYVEGEIPDGQPIITVANVSVPCPDGCTGSQSSSQLRLRDMERAADHQLNFDSSFAAASQPAASSFDCAEWESPSPRGPPLPLS